MLRNRTLAAMNRDDLAALIPHLTECHLSRGEMLTPQGSKVAHVYFPTTARIANTVTFSDGRSAETFVMGVEGVSGLAPFLADVPCAWGVETRAAGVAFRVPAAVLRQRMRRSESLLSLLLRLTNDYQAQAAVGVACAALHAAAPRLARMLLMTAERTSTDQVKLTQEDLGTLLGLQRTTVNEAAIELRNQGAIKYNRGVIQIVDWDRLEAAACECYSLQHEVTDAA